MFNLFQRNPRPMWFVDENGLLGRASSLDEAGPARVFMSPELAAEHGGVQATIFDRVVDRLTGPAVVTYMNGSRIRPKPAHKVAAEEKSAEFGNGKSVDWHVAMMSIPGLKPIPFVARIDATAVRTMTQAIEASSGHEKSCVSHYPGGRVEMFSFRSDTVPAHIATVMHRTGLGFGIMGASTLEDLDRKIADHIENSGLSAHLFTIDRMEGRTRPFITIDDLDEAPEKEIEHLGEPS